MLWLVAALAQAEPGVVRFGGPLAPRGAAARLTPTLGGLPVESGPVAWRDAAGVVRATFGRSLPPSGVGEPALSASEAVARAVPFGGWTPRARLSWQAVEGALRRVWTVALTRPVGVVFVRIDAVSGAVLSVEDGAVSSVAAPLARVYVHSPTVDETASEVPLPLAALGLSDDRVVLQQCRDEGELKTLELDSGDWELHVCTRSDADGPTDGDYLYDPVPYPEDPGRDEDAFAAPNVYWNVHEGLTWFDALGWVPSDDFVDPRLTVTVNQRNTDLWTLATASDPTAALDPYDNAYSTGGYLTSEEEWVPPELVFGQGAVVDYAYDADVIHHELAHYIVKSQGGPSRSSPTAFGPSARASALNEGIADYFACAIHGDPLLGEYAGYDAPVRDLGGTATCASDLTGEPHYDSLPFSQALWTLRTGLAEADRPTLDAALLDSLALMGTDVDFPDATAVVEAVVAERLGADVSGALAADWEARGLHSCLPVVDVPFDTEFRRFTQIPASYASATSGEVPGYLQFRVEIPEGGTRVVLTFSQLEYLGLDPYEINVPMPLEVVGRSGDALTWERVEVTGPTPSGEDTLTLLDWVSDGQAVATADETAVRPWIYDLQYAEHTYEAAWDVPTPGSYVFQLANGFARSATAYDLKVTQAPLVGPLEASSGIGGGFYRGGCGCAAAPLGAPMGSLVVLGLALVRRRGRPT